MCQHKEETEIKLRWVFDRFHLILHSTTHINYNLSIFNALLLNAELLQTINKTLTTFQVYLRKRANKTTVTTLTKTERETIWEKPTKVTFIKKTRQVTLKKKSEQEMNSDVSRPTCALSLSCTSCRL